MGCKRENDTMNDGEGVADDGTQTERALTRRNERSGSGLGACGFGGLLRGGGFLRACAREGVRRCVDDRT